MPRRPFQALRHREPRGRYDAVIIGAGVGGLICANLLARQGLAVLLAEQHYMVGGYCSTFRRAGYTFDAATHFYPLLGNPATLTGKLLRELGVEVSWVKMDPVDTFHLPDGTRFDVPADFAAYRHLLATAFPHQAAALEDFFAEVRRTYLLGLLSYFRGRDGRHLDPYRHLTLAQVLDAHFTDPRLKLVLTADCPHWGSPPSRTSFVFDSMLRLSYFEGNYYPEAGSQTFVDELARTFEQAGGEILMSSRVERIVVEGGAARGIEVTTTRGALCGRRCIRAGAVISNADLNLTLHQLLDPRQLDPGYLDAVRWLRPSWPCFLSHVGVEGVPTEVLAGAQGYYWQDWDAERMGRDGLTCKIFVPSLYAPALAPPGGHVVLLQKVLEMDYAAITDWPAHKAQVEAGLYAQLERAVPGISRRIVTRSSASAHTAWRFTLNTAGAMLGWEMAPDQLGDGRPDVRGPLRDLYLVGHWTRPGGGITPVIVSALRVATAIGQGSQPEEVAVSVAEPVREPLDHLRYVHPSHEHHFFSAISNSPQGDRRS